MTGCPPPGVLEQLLDERLSAPEAHGVSTHVDGCPNCQAVLEQLTREAVPPPAARPADEAALSHSPFLHRLKLHPPDDGPAQRRPRHAVVDLPTVPGYELLGELGSGGMGVVYKARQTALNRLVALKMILSGRQARPRDVERFRHETEAVARLRHPNIVQIHDVGEAEGRPYCALEYVEDGSLADWLRGDPQPLASAVRLLETLARAVQHAHEYGVIHCDLKPANVLLHLPPADGRRSQDRPPAPGAAGPADRLASALVKVSDFGLAKWVDASAEGTPSGELVGTPSYMAPEQAAGGGRPVGPATDVYALGAILYEMLTGRPPFKGATALDTALQVLHEEPVRPASLRPGLPPDLETVCLKCLAKDPARRYASAAALADDLHRFLQGRPIAARPVGPLERAAKWARRKPVVAALAGGMLLVTLLGYAGVTWQWHEAAHARDVALAEKRDKEEQRLEAVEARADAVAAQQNEAAQRRQVRTALYYSRIAQSQLAWKANDYAGACQALAGGRPVSPEEERRGWEWYYLEGLHHSYLLNLGHDPAGAAGALAYSPDGSSLASVVGGAVGDRTAPVAEVRLWEAGSGRVRWMRPVAASLHRLAFAGGRLVLGGGDGGVQVWDAATATEQLRFRPHTAAVSGLAVSPDGRRVASASWDHTVRLWDVASGVVTRTWRRHEARVQSVSFHPDGRRVASGCWDGKVRLWSLDRDEPLETWSGHRGAVYGVAFSPDGRLLASAGQNGTLRIWEVSTGRTVQTLTGGIGAVLGVAWSPDARYLGYGGGDATVRVWDVEAGVELAVYRGHTAAVEALAFSPDGQRLASCTPAAGNVKVWDLTRHPEHATLARSAADLETVALTDQGRVVSVAVGGALQVWDRSTGVLVEERSLPISREVISPGAPVLLDPAGRRVAGRWAADPRIVKIWEVAGGTETAVCRGHDAPVTAVRFSPDGQRLATTAWRAPTGKRLGEHEIAVWDVASGRRLAAWTGSGCVRVLAFAPDGRWLAWGGDGDVGLADWEHGAKIVEARAHRGSVAALAFHPDGDTLASGGLDDRTVQVWRPGLAAELPARLQPRCSLPAPLLLCDLCFSPDGRRLAGASRDLVKLWDVEARQEVLTLRGAVQRHFDPPFNPRVAFSPDGRHLAAINWDESISLWRADPVENGADSTRLERRRHAADARALAWHIEEAEHCLEQKNLAAARFHLARVRAADLTPPLRGRLGRVVDLLGTKKQ